MSLGGILILVLLVISLFVFIYLIVITARSWGVLHTVLLCFLFIECWTFLFFSARALDKRLAMLKDYSTTAKNVAQLKKEVQQLTWGGDNISEDQEAYVPLSGTVRRLAADRGRVWRNVTKLNVEGESIRLELTPPVAAAGGEDLGGAAPAAAAPGEMATIPMNMVVYAFSQTANEQNQSVPKIYLGAYKVVESSPGNALVTPITPLEPQQRTARDQEGTWALYELVPQDSHVAFLAAGAKPDENKAFGDMDEPALQALLAGVPEARRPAVLASYMRDGQAAQETDDPNSVWVLAEVVKPFKQQVDDAAGNAKTGTYFDSQGRSIDMRLMSGAEDKSVTLPEGKQLLLPQKEAATHIQGGFLKLIRRVYIRPLNSYEKGMAYLRIRRAEVQRLVDVVARESQQLQQANDLGQATKQSYIALQQKLAADRDQYQKEVEVVGNELNAVTTNYQTMRKQMLQYWQAIHAAHDSMVKGL
ncbi:MAG: hypothetical protein IT423_13395 [Pirellulaceae bacterium]|nr:hypothetical protein [Pirellulaceae bacterium]